MVNSKVTLTKQSDFKVLLLELSHRPVLFIATHNYVRDSFDST